MKLNDAAAKLVSALYPSREFDESAETVKELAVTWGCSIRTAHKRVADKLENGIIEEVFKKGPRRPLPAYRMKGKVVSRPHK